MKSESFSSKIGLILAAAGSAIGLGNIWKFPYIAGMNGGGAFLLVYLSCVVIFGMPLIIMELYIGKRSRKSAFGAFRALSGNGRWQWLSWLCVITAFLIMGFYFVVTGWCFNYLWEAIIGRFHGMDTTLLSEHFASVMTDTPRMLVFGLAPLLLTAAVVWFDVNKGIERLSKLLMPLLLVMMVVMMVRVLLLDGGPTGARFFLHADFSKITPSVIMQAMGQAFFSLSIGLGALITYGAYMPKDQNVPNASLQIIILDTLVAFMAGMIIFPAVFAFGFNPAEGPQLVFVVLPAIFEQMSFSWFSGVAFFLLLGIAAITSTISLMEVVVAFLCEATATTRRPLNRRKSVCLITGIAVGLVILCQMIPAVFNLFDQLTANYLMPIGALGMSILVGWTLSKPSEKTYLQENGFKPWIIQAFTFILRWVVPVMIVLIFFKGLNLF